MTLALEPVALVLVLERAEERRCELTNEKGRGYEEGGNLKRGGYEEGRDIQEGGLLRQRVRA